MNGAAISRESYCPEWAMEATWAEEGLGRLREERGVRSDDFDAQELLAEEDVIAMLQERLAANPQEGAVTRA